MTEPDPDRPAAVRRTSVVAGPVTPPEPLRPIPRRSGDGPGVLVSISPRVLATVFSACALVLPLASTAICLVVGVVLAGRRHALSVFAVVWATWRLVVCTSFAVLVAGGLGGGRWVIWHGLGGALSAGRIAVVHNGPRVLAFAICYSVLRAAVSGSGLGARIRSDAANLPPGAQAVAAVCGLLWVAACALVIAPSGLWPATGSVQGVVQVSQPGLRGGIENLEASVAEYEARAVVRCTAARGRGGWDPPRVVVAADGNIVAVVPTDSRARAGNRSLAVLLLALQNQLLPYVKAVEYVYRRQSGRSANLRVGRQAASQPVTRVAAIVGTAAPGRLGRAAAEISRRDVDVALRCSVAAI